jgi:hypothetical protein
MLGAAQYLRKAADVPIDPPIDTTVTDADERRN